jgi:hypothetical protein
MWVGSCTIKIKAVIKPLFASGTDGTSRVLIFHKGKEKH